MPLSPVNPPLKAETGTLSTEHGELCLPQKALKKKKDFSFFWGAFRYQWHGDGGEGRAWGPAGGPMGTSPRVTVGYRAGRGWQHPAGQPDATPSAALPTRPSSLLTPTGSYKQIQLKHQLATTKQTVCN